MGGVQRTVVDLGLLLEALQHRTPPRGHHLDKLDAMHVGTHSVVRSVHLLHLMPTTR